MMRSRVCTALCLSVAALVCVGPFALAVPSVAHAEVSEDIGIGSQLEALSDVHIERAEISKGSKVSVTQLKRQDGRITSVHVELADGQVARVAIATIRNFFRVVEP